MDRTSVWGLLNAIFYGMDCHVQDLSRATASECAVAILTPGGYFALHAPNEFVEAIETTLSAGRLPESKREYSERFSDEELLAFLHLLLRELQARMADEPTRSIAKRLSE